MQSDSIKVLLIEDKPDYAGLLRKIFGAPSFNTKVIRKLKAAVQDLVKNNYDVILLDPDSADAGGLDAVTRVHEKAAHTPILVLSDVDNPQLAYDSIGRGAEDYLLKEKMKEDILIRVVRYAVERSRIKAELELNEQKYKILYEQSKDGILLHDFSGKILDVNQRALNLFGYQQSEMIGKKIYNLHLASEVRSSRKAFKQVAEKGYSLFETKVRNKKGEVFFAEVSASIFQIGNRQLIQSIIRDITARKQTEQKLLLQDAALTSAANGIVITDRDGTIIWVNPVFKKLTGYDPKEIIGKNPKLLKSGHHDKKFYKNLWDTILSGKVWRGELVNLKKDGSLYFEEQTITPVKNETGEITHFVGIKNDISDRKRSENALIESQKRYYNLFNNSLNGFALHEIVTNKKGRPVDYIFLEVNRAFEKLTGLKAKNVIGRKVTEIISGIEKEPFIEIYGKVALTGEPIHFEQFSPALGRHFEIAAFSPQENQFAAVFTDITERKNAEEALRDHDQKLRTIIEHSDELFYIHDTRHQLTFVSPQSKEIFGYTPEEMMIKWTTLTTDNPLNDEGLKITERAIATGERQPPYLLELRRKNGTPITVEIDESPVLDETDQVIGISGALRNVTEKKRAEVALVESEEKFRSLAEQSPNMIFINQNGRIVYANKKSTEILGYSKEELYSPSFDFRDLIASESLDLVRKEFHNHMEGKNVVPYEYTIITREGKRVEAINSTKLIDYEGEKAILGVVTDITERKHSELSLKESEERLKILFEFAPDTILLSDLEGNLINANKAGEEMTGYSREELIGKNLLKIDILNDPQIPKVAELLARNAENQPAGPDEFIINRKDGSEVIIEIRTYPIKIQNQLLMLGIARDITERRKAEEAIRTSEEKFRSLFEESKDAIYISSTYGKFIDINPAGVQLFGYESKDELLQVDIASDLYLNPEDRLKFQDELIRNGYVQDHEVALKRKDGMKITVLVTATSIRGSDGNIMAYRGFIRDITEQKLLEQQLLQAQKMEAIGTLAGGIAHDFNNILSAILGYTELTIELMNGDGLAKRNLEQVYSAGLRAKDLIQQILTFSRQTQHTPQALKMELIVKEALKLLRASLPATIQIQQNLEKDCGHVLADPTQIHQIVVNLCTNAYDAMRDQGGILQVRLSSIEVSQHQPDENITVSPGKYVSLTVSDTGIGMKEETLKRMFDPFFTTKEAGVGTGLGLSVVHGIVKKHGGEIVAKSEEGKGTTFTIYLPAFESKSEKISEEPREFLTGTERILYVDDEEPIVRAGAQILEKLGYQVTGKTQSVEALETFKKSPDQFDLVISDLTMPTLTGIDLAQKIMEIRPGIPIILITGFSETITRERARQLGIRDLIMKPILTADLSRTIRRILDQQKVGT